MQFYLTDAGRQAIIDQKNLGLKLSLSQFVLGTAQYDASDEAPSMTAIKNQIASSNISNGLVESYSGELRLIAIIKSVIMNDAYEVGILTDTGVLFAVASRMDGYPLLRLAPNVGSVLTVNIAILNVDISNVKITVDANSPLAVALMADHIANKDPHPQYTKKTLFDQAYESTIEKIQNHVIAKNPHPQYLLASTFGVNLPMTASLDTPLDDAHNVYNWNGKDGQTSFRVGGIRWWHSASGKVKFQPFRAYGTFLLYFNFQPQGKGDATLTTYNSDDTVIKKEVVANINSTAKQAPIKHLFTLPSGGYAELDYSLSVWNKAYGDGAGAFYVDDRPKEFSPVGYTSTVDFSNISGTEEAQQDDGYSIYPDDQWFYYSNSTKTYITLSGLSTFANPTNHIPHYNRTNLPNNKSSSKIYIIVEVGLQSVENPNSDYTAKIVRTVQGTTDGTGDIVVGIPFDMRTVATPNSETLVYRFAYYENEVTKDLNDDFPSGTLDGIHTIYSQIGVTD